MIEYLFKYIFWDINLAKIIILVILSLIIFLLYYLSSHFCRRILRSLKGVVMVEEATVVAMTTLWIASLFYLHISLPLWVGFYFVYSRHEVKNRVIKYHFRYWNRKYDSEKFRKILSRMGVRHFLKDLRNTKKEIYDKTNKQFISKEQWKSTLLSPRLYLSGLIVFSLVILVLGSPYAETGSFALIYFGNIIMATGIMYAVYLMFYLLSVKWDWGEYSGNTEVFHVAFLLSYGVCIYAMYWWTVYTI